MNYGISQAPQMREDIKSGSGRYHLCDHIQVQSFVLVQYSRKVIRSNKYIGLVWHPPGIAVSVVGEKKGRENGVGIHAIGPVYEPVSNGVPRNAKPLFFMDWAYAQQLLTKEEQGYLAGLIAFVRKKGE